MHVHHLSQLMIVVYTVLKQQKIYKGSRATRFFVVKIDIRKLIAAALI